MPVVCSDRAKGEPSGPGRLGKYDRRGGERIVSLTGNHMSWAFLLRKPFEEKWVIMYKIAFQADNRLVAWRLCSLLLFFFLPMARSAGNSACAQRFSSLCCHSFTQASGAGSLQTRLFRLIELSLTENMEIMGREVEIDSGSKLI